MAKKTTKEKEVANENVSVDEVTFEPLNEKSKVVIILLASKGLVKVDTEKTVSGNVANILIKKGLAELKK